MYSQGHQGNFYIDFGESLYVISTFLISCLQYLVSLVSNLFHLYSNIVISAYTPFSCAPLENTPREKAEINVELIFYAFLISSYHSTELVIVLEKNGCLN